MNTPILSGNGRRTIAVGGLLWEEEEEKPSWIRCQWHFERDCRWGRVLLVPKQWAIVLVRVPLVPRYQAGYILAQDIAADRFVDDWSRCSFTGVSPQESLQFHLQSTALRSNLSPTEVAFVRNVFFCIYFRSW